VVEGVSVVAQGGGDSQIQKNITEVIQALFGIEAHKIKVVKMKQEE
jgi:stage III sporulation protein AG